MAGSALFVFSAVLVSAAEEVVASADADVEGAGACCVSAAADVADGVGVVTVLLPSAIFTVDDVG